MERELTLRSLSPLVFHADRSRTQFTPGLDYISGSALRGAVAAHYLQARGADADFQALFVAKHASCPDALPSTETAPGRLLPVTAYLCKRHRWHHPDSLTDTLLRLALAEMMGNLEALRDPAWEYCPEQDCQKQVQKPGKRDRVMGYVLPTYEHVQPEKRLLTGTSINRATGTAEARLLFSQEALAEGQFFRGVVRITGDNADKLQARLESVLQVGDRLHMGAARSRGLGLVEVVSWGDPWSELALELRLRLFNDSMQELWRHYDAEHDNAEYFTMTLESHLLLRDAASQPVTRLEGRSDLTKLLELEGVTLCRHAIVPAMVRGWNAQQGLPKEDEPALGRGSALLFRVEPGHEAAVHERLAVLEAEGLGRRRSEGFGRVRVCNSFHYDIVLRETEGAS